ncbi:MAG: sigma-54-dependent Fis family transcriptional regulator [Rhodocyclaceae bacterium]|nr:MAG: sigma-54-dependent Fis family transcriptional regulator [Rhodocyclaceae bacterium]
MNRPIPRESIRRSWERCAQQGLDMADTAMDGGLRRSALNLRLEEKSRLIAYAHPLIEHLHQSLARTSSLIVLTDESATVLRTLGDPGIVARAEEIALFPGAVWSEERMGTNAIGLALNEGQAAAVIEDEHYLLRHRFLRGIACPIPMPDNDGGILGVLGIISDGDLSIPHARALVQNAVDLIETRLVETHPHALCQIRIAPSQEALATPLEGILVVDEEGRVAALNRRARQFSGACHGRAIDEALHLSPQEKQRLLKSAADRPVCLVNTRRQTFWSRLTQPPAFLIPEAAAVETSQDDDTALPLVRLDTGDSRMKAAIQRALRVVDRNIPLMIQGETGSGKEVFAQACHLSSLRSRGPFVAINCAAIPGPLIEAELFGYSEGAFTGARQQGSAGKLREAHGGTLFLDEIGDMPVGLQSVLLRVLETRSVSPLGGGEEIPLDIAIICASHQPLQEKVAEGSFRADLFFRLSGMSLCIPPLRERSDLAALAQRILEQECGGQAPRLTAEALDLLRRHPWPGNIRQLRNVLRLAAAMIDPATPLLRPEHLPAELSEGGTSNGPTTSHHSLRASEVRLVKEAVTRCGGNISAAARELGITRTTLYRKLQQDAEP